MSDDNEKKASGIVDAAFDKLELAGLVAVEVGALGFRGLKRSFERSVTLIEKLGARLEKRLHELDDGDDVNPLKVKPHAPVPAPDGEPLADPTFDALNRP